MTKEQIKSVLDRVLTWPPERQEEEADLLLMMEAREGERYHPTEEEWAAIEQGVEQVERGEFASDEEMQAFWKRHGS
jgi:hypothetical protein